MDFLVIGMILWITIHLLPVSFVGIRRRLVDKLGLMPYKGLFALSILGSVTLMVLGWQSIESITFLYDLGPTGRLIGLVLLIIGFVLIASSKIKNNINRIIRHPELTGVSCWALAHLLMNGEQRAVILFGGFFVWAIATIFLLNKRDGTFVPPAPQLPHKSILTVAVGFVMLIVLALLHPYFAGVAIAP